MKTNFSLHLLDGDNVFQFLFSLFRIYLKRCCSALMLAKRSSILRIERWRTTSKNLSPISRKKASDGSSKTHLPLIIALKVKTLKCREESALRCLIDRVFFQKSDTVEILGDYSSFIRRKRVLQVLRRLKSFTLNQMLRHAYDGVEIRSATSRSCGRKGSTNCI